jgi:hypothetical protein
MTAVSGHNRSFQRNFNVLVCPLRARPVYQPVRNDPGLYILVPPPLDQVAAMQ